MLYIGLCGYRHTGKSIVSDLFQDLGIHVFDADTILKLHAQSPNLIGYNEFKSKNYEGFLRLTLPFVLSAWKDFKLSAEGTGYTIFMSNYLLAYSEPKKKFNLDSIISVETNKKKLASRITKMSKEKMKRQSLNGILNQNLQHLSSDHSILNNNETSKPEKLLVERVEALDKIFLKELVETYI